MFNELLSKIYLVDNLTKAGLLTPELSTKLRNEAIQSLFNNEGVNSSAPPVNLKPEVQDTNNQESSSKLLENQNIKEFLEKYFKNPDKDFLLNFENLITNVKSQAIQNHENIKNHEKTLQSSNENAKNKLISQTQIQDNMPIEGEKLFTLEEVDKMSMDDFDKNETAILQQLEKGLFN